MSDVHSFVRRRLDSRRFHSGFEFRNWQGSVNGGVKQEAMTHHETLSTYPSLASRGGLASCFLAASQVDGSNRGSREAGLLEMREKTPASQGFLSRAEARSERAAALFVRQNRPGTG
jgi:hypothetical protein